MRLRDLEYKSSRYIYLRQKYWNYLFGSDKTIARTLIHNIPMLPSTNGGSNEMVLTGTKHPSLTIEFLNSEKQHESNLSYLEEFPPITSLMDTGSHAIQSNEHKLLSERISVEDLILISTTPSLDSHFESEAVLGNLIQCDIESMVPS